MNIPYTLILNICKLLICHYTFRNFSVLLFNGIFHIVQGCFCF